MRDPKGPKPNVVAIIPARMASTRFPNKPMALIHGVPMVGHVYFRTRLAKSVTETYVATCDREIFDYVRSIGGKAVMTSDRHERCSDRTAEAMLKLEAETGRRVDVVAMVQGDEPMADPAAIDLAVRTLLGDESLKILCLMAPLETAEAFDDPNQVKVVVDLKGDALYFSREPIPSRKKAPAGMFSAAGVPAAHTAAGASPPRFPMFKQYPIIPFRRDYLLRFNSLPPTPLEIIESIDLMRVLEHGDEVRMVPVDKAGLSVDTPKDLERVVRAMEGDRLMREYAKAAERA